MGSHPPEEVIGKRVPTVDIPEKKLIVSICHHGVSDSFATKAMLEQCIDGNRRLQDKFDIIARGIEPIRTEPQKQPDGSLRGHLLTMEEIRKAVLLVVHNSNKYRLDGRFGPEFTNVADTIGYLMVRDGRECQHAERNVGHNHKRHIQSCCKDFNKLLMSALSREPLEERMNDEVLHAAEMSNEDWLEKYHKRLHQKAGKKRGGKHRRHRR